MLARSETEPKLAVNLISTRDYDELYFSGTSFSACIQSFVVNSVFIYGC